MAEKGWFKYCIACTIKHLLNAEGHLTEAIVKSSRDGKPEDAIMYSRLLNRTSELRKEMEDVYLTKELLIE